MVYSYHDSRAFVRRWGVWTGRLAAMLVVASGLGGCSISMPMAGLIDEAQTGSVAAKPPADADAEVKDKPAVELAALRPTL